jgi:hypothetical protein
VPEVINRKINARLCSFNQTVRALLSGSNVTLVFQQKVLRHALLFRLSQQERGITMSMRLK